MRIIIDTNVALDVLLNRNDFLPASLDVLKLAAIDKVAGFITTKAVSDMYYVLYKNSKDVLKTKNAVEQLIKIINLESLIPSDITLAFKSDIKDYEDAVVCMVAKRIKADYIVTRNDADFINSPIPALKPADFLTKFSSST